MLALFCTLLFSGTARSWERLDEPYYPFQATMEQAAFEVAQIVRQMRQQLRDGFPVHRRVRRPHGHGARYIQARYVYLRSLNLEPLTIFPLGQAAPWRYRSHQIELTKALGIPFLMYINPQRDYAIGMGVNFKIAQLEEFNVAYPFNARYTEVFFSIGASF